MTRPEAKHSRLPYLEPPPYSPIEWALAQVHGNAVINLASGSPDPRVAPIEEISRTSREILRELEATALMYPSPGGVEPLKRSIRRWCEYLQLGRGRVTVTSGAQHAIKLISELLLRGRKFAHEDPTFVEGMFPLLGAASANIPIPVDSLGMDTDRLESALRSGSRPLLVYSVPTCNNPTGVTMTLERRKHLLELADTYDFTILEDDPYRAVALSPSTSLYKLRPDRVIYVGSMSKVISPGLRIGFVYSKDEELETQLSRLAQTDFSTSTLNQYIVSRLIDSGFVQGRVNMLRTHYRRKLLVMRDALESNDLTREASPEDGFFTLVSFSKPSLEVFKASLRRGVVFVPAENFYYSNTKRASRFARLSAGYPKEEDIEPAVKVIADSARL